MLIKVESPVLGLGAYRRNVIINGDFCIAQRAVGALSTSWAWAHCDRWQAAASGTGVAGVLQQGANGKGIKRFGLFSYGTSFTSGTIAFRQRIESTFSMALRGNVFSAKAWIYHDHTAAMNFQFAINYPTVQDNWAAEATLFTSPSVSIPSGVVTEMTYTFPVLPDDATGWSGLSLIIRSVGNITVANKTIGITNVQLESGPQSTKFENLPVGEVLALCQRYFEKSWDLSKPPGTASSEGVKNFYSSVTATNYLMVEPKVRKRTVFIQQVYSAAGTPGWVTDFTAGAEVGLIDNNVIGESSGQFSISAVIGHLYQFHWTAIAEL